MTGRFAALRAADNARHSRRLAKEARAEVISEIAILVPAAIILPIILAALAFMPFHYLDGVHAAQGIAVSEYTR